MVRSLVDVARRRPLLPIALAFVAAGLLFFAVFPADSSVTSDDGAYELAVQSLRHDGSWSVDYVLDAADPTGIGSPFHNAVHTDDGYFPYVRRPLWIVTLAGADAVAGIGGQRFLLLVCAAIAIGLTGRIARAARVPASATLAGILVALSPLPFDSLQLWAHAASVAAVALLAWSALIVMDEGPRPWPIALGCVGAVVGVAVRPESAIFAAAVAAACVLSGLRARRLGTVVGGLTFAVVAAAVHLGSARIGAAIAGSGTRGASPTATAVHSRSSGGLSDRVHGLVTTVISVRDSTVLGIVLVLLALVLVVYAVVVARQGRVGEARVLVVVAAALWVVRIVLTPDELPPGLLGAWPVVVIVALDGWSDRTDGERRLFGIIGLATLGVLATQYDNGGGLNWGARFLAPALPLLAVLVAATLQRARSASPRGRTFSLAVVGLAAVTTVASLVGDATLRTRTDDAIDRVAAGADSGVVVTASIALPRLAWRTYPEVDYVVVPPGDGDTIRAALEQTGIDQVTVFQLPDEDFAAISGRPGTDNEPGAVVDVTVADG